MAENWMERAARMRARVLTMTDDELREAIDLAREADYERRRRDDLLKREFQKVVKEVRRG